MAAQSGKTEMMLDVAGQRIDQRPAPVLYVGPNKQFLSEQFEPRVMTMLDGCESLSLKVARGKRMTKTRKTIGGVPFRLAHAGSSSALKSDPAALALVDEYDEMGGNVQGQGGVLGLVELRGGTFADFACVVTSTPKKGRVEVVKDSTSGLQFWEVADTEDIESPIWALWQQGTRHHWTWQCRHCQEFFVPRFNLLRWPENATPSQAETQTWLECPNNGCEITEADKEWMNERGKYVAPGQKIDRSGNIAGAPPQGRTLSYWCSGIASPFVTMGGRVAAYLEAVALGDDAEIQAAVNGGFGELYTPGDGEVADWTELREKSKRSLYARGTVPDGVLFLTLTVDVQKQSLPWVLRGWGARATSWLVDYGYLRGDTAEDEVWHVLREHSASAFDEMHVRLTLIDSGFRPGKADTLPLNRVYEFCRSVGRRARPTKGSSNPMRTPLLFSKIEVNRAGKASKFGLDLLRLDTDHWKQWVHERLRWDETRPGAWMLPKDVDEDYCRQVVSEARLVGPNGKPEWVQRGRHNHFLDCEAMQAAAGYLLNVQRIPLQNVKPRAIPSAGREPDPLQEVTETEPQDAASNPSPQSAAKHLKVPRRRGTRRIVRSNFLGA